MAEQLLNASDAPIIFFEGISTFSNNNGIVGLMLVAGLTLPTDDGGTVGKVSAVAHLRCSIAVAVALRDALDRALLLGVPTAGGTQ